MSNQEEKKGIVKLPEELPEELNLAELQKENELNPRDLLTAEEKEELGRYTGGLDQEPNDSKKTEGILAGSTARTFFELFLNGHTTKEIYNQNKSFPWGMIIDARIRYDWDKERDVYTRELFTGVRQKLIKNQIESVHMLADLLAATHKNIGGRLKKYLQTGDETLIKDINLTSIHSYGKTVALLMKMTGQEKELGSLRVLLEDADKKTSTTVDGQVIPTEPLAPSPAKMLPASVAANIVNMLLEKKKEEK
ncbi:MAG: hypothetical protein ACTSVM_01625 [Candidatus Ranarchaeia archaeon]